MTIDCASHIIKSMLKGDELTTAEVAAMAGVVISTVTRAVQMGELTPTWRAPGQRGAMWFDRTDVMAWLEKRLSRHVPPALAS